MPVSFRFTMPDDDPYVALEIDACQQRLQDASLSLSSRLSLLRHQGRLFMESGQHHQALEVLNEAIALQPDNSFSLAVKGLALEQIGRRKDAKKSYQAALSYLSDPSHPITAQIWYRYGVVLRTQGRHRQALEKYDKAIALNPNYAEALSGRSVVLALMGHHKRAKQESDRALSLAPESPQILNNSGIVLMATRKYGLALVQFQEVLLYDPDFDRAWYNRGLALTRLGQSEEALESLERSLEQYRPRFDQSPSASPQTEDSRDGFKANFQAPMLHRHSIPPWVISAWTLHAFLSLKRRHLSTTIHSSRQAQTIDPNNYSAALYKVTAIVGKGQFWSHVTTQEGRKELGHDAWVIADGLKYRLFGLFLVMALLLWGDGQVMDIFRQYVPLVLSFGIIALVGMDLWRHKSRLRFVWNTYFGGGIVGSLLTYVRAIVILIITLTTFTVTYQHAPAFMRWGWANSVFGASGNIIFQPLNLIQDLSFHHWLRHASELEAGLHSLLANVPLVLWDNLWGIWGKIFPVSSSSAFSSPHTPLLSVLITHGSIGLGFLGTPLFHVGNIHVTMATLLIILFWLALIVGVPFWAHLEEKIFRQGANTWSTITIRSIQFGLVHLLAGIPILGGFVLIVPGFLFACRYKYVRDRHYRRYQDPYKAEVAGVLASTADHAVYNAILMTLAVSTILLDQMSV